jgi:cupin 2 domain-containing protein
VAEDPVDASADLPEALPSDLPANLPANLFADLPPAGPDEVFERILAVAGAVRGLAVERIVSTGQASPPGFFYDQPRDEWVLVLAGTAELRFADEAAPRTLRAGDHLLIPARRRHRVERTDRDPPTIWLAVHFGRDGPEDDRAAGPDQPASRTSP